MEEINEDNIKDYHKTSYKGILRGYTRKDILESFPVYVSIGVMLLTIVFIRFTDKSLYHVLGVWVNQVLTIFPNLLGFNLGGYALIIGFGNTDLVGSLTKIKKGKKSSLFQKLSSVFAFTLILQSFTFSIAFIFNLSIQLDLKTDNIVVYNTLNFLGILILSFLGSWGIFILFSLIANVFTFGQMHHFHLTIKRLSNVDNTQKTSSPPKNEVKPRAKE